MNIENLTTTMNVRVIEWKDGHDRSMTWAMGSVCPALALIEMPASGWIDGDGNDPGLMPFAWVGCVKHGMYPVGFADEVKNDGGIFPTYADAMDYAIGRAFLSARRAAHN
jgi:hypothetical protein